MIHIFGLFKASSCSWTKYMFKLNCIMEECRCCLTPGTHKNLKAQYSRLGKTEIYAEMLKECFNIVLSSSAQWSTAICDQCIDTLRSSVDFRRQVLRVEQQLLERTKALEDGIVEVKTEPLDVNGGEDSDDYFLPCTEVKIKKEPKPDIKKRHRSVREKCVGVNPEWEGDDTNIPTNNRVDAKDKEKSMKRIKRRTVTIERSKVKLQWTRTAIADKMKHRENLLTVLKYSNATPFKKKSLVGFSCAYCEGAYPDPGELRRHTRAEHAAQRLELRPARDLSQYYVNLDVDNLACTLCEKTLDNLTTLKEHLTKTHQKTFHADIKDHILEFKLKSGDVFDCAKCASTYETFKMLKQHMNKHYSNYVCGKCGTAFATKRSLHSHRNVHKEGSYKCGYCDKVFSNRPKKCYHEKLQHLGESNISKCQHCGAPFKSYYQRNQHLIRVHNDEAKYKCNVCNKSYLLKSLLMYHIKRNHLLERNCQCTECGYRFFSKKALKAHMVRHTGERIYACEVCGKAYARKYTLREHMRIHNNDRRFKCHVCSLTFVQKCSLKSHLLSNHGISVAACEITMTTN
ncbi:zinc finger protein 260 isoform X1 [Bombyx mori]|uniref:Uncharacterized protein n=1 Tax=Bombyx mori TaxID=7091 RepID=A0A8R1WH35_BOMMO|nr:zinc finger protein 260 isoform X2 [Bombyx mori]